MSDTKFQIPKELFDHTQLEPVKVFDNIYCITTKSVGVWILETNDGLVMFDSMWNDEDAKFILEAMGALGLSKEELKYIVLTHGHVDHYGGASYLKKQINAKIIMSLTDYDFMKYGNNGPDCPKCEPDIKLVDEQVLDFKGTKVDIIKTPGHTPGCLSFILEAKDNGKVHKIVLWGGIGFPREDEWKKDYKKTLEKFLDYLNNNNIDGVILAHLFLDNGYENLDKSKKRNDLEEHPFIIGKEKVIKYFEEMKKNLISIME